MDKLTNRVVLIVDDEETNAFALGSYLTAQKMKVTIAGNGAEAMRMLESGQIPDVMLLDMAMPIMDGFETLTAMRQSGKYRSIPVIAVTANAMRGDKEKCLEAGAWDYMPKPIDIKALIEMMGSCMSIAK